MSARNHIQNKELLFLFGGEFKIKAKYLDIRNPAHINFAQKRNTVELICIIWYNV